MARYEQILNKISPVFYKFIRYQNYFIPNLISSYLQSANAPNTLEVTISPINSYYFFYIHGIRYIKNSNILEGKTTTDKLVMLTKIEKASYITLSIDEFLIDEIINKFSHLKSYTEKIFIALIGKDTFEAIRANIK